MTDVKTILVGTIGQGVLRSADGGETWGRIGIGAVHNPRNARIACSMS